MNQFNLYYFLIYFGDIKLNKMINLIKKSYKK